MSAIAKLSLKEYERIVATGVFDGKNRRRLELIRGELREMNPIGPDHCTIVDRLAEWSFDSAPRAKVRVRVQNPLAFETVDSEPEPDIVWAKRKDYAAGHPIADDVLLLIEVAVSSLDNDRGEKSEVYADVGIQEYWIVNVVERTIEVRRDPEGGHYRSVRSFRAGETVQPLAAPNARLSVDSLFAES
ncbi:MAG TPA: Uma2 family endonuclease [Pirellulales bacterium]|jgi:Uma2 family endonuclease|nr:Uma2 family endonuclease [Pirellulales bacterium]